MSEPPEVDSHGRPTPRAFMSYSRHSSEHIGWVQWLAERLQSDGVEVTFDVWDTESGSNLQAFMEGARSTDFVLAVCSDEYVKKADGHAGGVGYEKQIVTASLMESMGSSVSVKPLVRDNSGTSPGQILPIFLSGRIYLDFRAEYPEAAYTQLIHELHGRAIQPRPKLGTNPFDRPSDEVRLSESEARYASPSLSGRVSFDYSNNNGTYRLGSGDLGFETQWTEAGDGSIHAYNDGRNIAAIALARGVSDPRSISDAAIFDQSSRVRTPRSGDVVIFRNRSGFYAAVAVRRVSVATISAPAVLEFDYVIQPNRTADMTLGIP